MSNQQSTQSDDPLSRLKDYLAAADAVTKEAEAFLATLNSTTSKAIVDASFEPHRLTEYANTFKADLERAIGVAQARLARVIEGQVLDDTAIKRARESEMSGVSGSADSEQVAYIKAHPEVFRALVGPARVSKLVNQQYFSYPDGPDEVVVDHDEVIRLFNATVQRDPDYTLEHVLVVTDPVRALIVETLARAGYPVQVPA